MNNETIQRLNGCRLSGAGRAGIPNAVVPFGKFRMTSELAPTTQSSPTDASLERIVPEPRKLRAPTEVPPASIDP